MGYGVYVGSCTASPLQATSTNMSAGSSKSSGMDFSFISSPIITRQGYAAEQGRLCEPWGVEAARWGWDISPYPPLYIIPHGTPRLREPSTHYKTPDIALVVF